MAQLRRSRATWLAFLIICVMNVKNGIADLCIDNAIYCDVLTSICNNEIDPATSLPSCICLQGYEKDNFDVCVPEDPCLDPLINICNVNADCLPTGQLGGFVCSCFPGFEGDGYVC
ncbi:unnamed protein product, partial [Owenia fusiformis]